MRYLVLSDLHSNWEALQAVLADARGRYDRIVCCGDLAGYGPDPNLIVEWSRQNLYAVIRGNHDRGCAGIEDLEWFNPVARTATVWTMSQLEDANRRYLRDLPAGPLTVDGFQLVHGSPLDEDEYVMSWADARKVFSYIESNIVFFGHSHMQGVFMWMNGRYGAIGHPDPWDVSVDLTVDPDGAYLINPGSVGQPRDGDPRASWALYDTESRELAQCRTKYDSAPTRRKMLAAGLPDILAARLVVGR